MRGLILYVPGSSGLEGLESATQGVAKRGVTSGHTDPVLHIG